MTIGPSREPSAARSESDAQRAAAVADRCPRCGSANMVRYTAAAYLDVLCQPCEQRLGRRIAANFALASSLSLPIAMLGLVLHLFFGLPELAVAIGFCGSIAVAVPLGGALASRARRQFLSEKSSDFPSARLVSRNGNQSQS